MKEQNRGCVRRPSSYGMPVLTISVQRMMFYLHVFIHYPVRVRSATGQDANNYSFKSDPLRTLYEAFWSYRKDRRKQYLCQYVKV